jgi:3',5'-cyclic AMP phosphodiesterase CpdA
MNTLTWLHISDLHFRASKTYDADVVLKALLRDIAERIQQDNLRPDFIAATGDVAFSGQPDEYKLAQDFFDKLLAATDVPRERLFVVPGNHDASRGLVSTGAKAIAAQLNDRDSVNAVLATPDDRRLMMARFKGYAEFVNSYLNQGWGDERYFYVRPLDMAGRKVALLGLNSAWLCASDQDKANGLLIGERQARTALDEVEGIDLKIALMHHPFDWLREFDQNDSAAMLTDGCDFILHGHLHQTAMTQLTSPDSSAMILACGACYETRQWPNMYNWVQLNLDAGTGTVYLRRYSDARGGFWAPDTLTYRNVKNGEYPFSLRGGPTRPTSGGTPTAPAVPSGQVATASGGSAAATGGSTAIVGNNNIVVSGNVQGGIHVTHGGAPPAQPSASQGEYDLQAVRELLGTAFSDEEILTLAFDRFRDVYEEIEGESSKPKKIRLLVNWCKRRGQMEILLAEVKQRNPNQYTWYAARPRGNG